MDIERPGTENPGSSEPIVFWSKRFTPTSAREVNILLFDDTIPVDDR
jgi:hypothetical protein